MLQCPLARLQRTENGEDRTEELRRDASEGRQRTCLAGLAGPQRGYDAGTCRAVTPRSPGPRHDGGVPVFRSFADGEKTTRSHARRGSRERRTPVGKVHAAELDATSSLCGVDLEELHEFGRSHWPFERFPQGSRCATCNEAAGRPLA